MNAGWCFVFTEKEIAYLKSQPLARIASVSTSGRPDNSATVFEFDGEVFYLGISALISWTAP